MAAIVAAFHRSGQIVLMVVPMAVDRDRLARLAAEQPSIFGVASHLFRDTFTADVAVNTEHTVAGAEHDMQIVRDE